MLDLMPIDIIYHISSYMEYGNIHPLVLIKNIYDNDYISAFSRFRIVKCNKIKLYLRLRLHQRLLFQQLKIILEKYHYTMTSNHNIAFPLFNNQCLFYSPLTPYNKCRFCLQHQFNHKYHKMIHMFLDLVY